MDPHIVVDGEPSDGALIKYPPGAIRANRSHPNVSAVFAHRRARPAEVWVSINVAVSYVRKLKRFDEEVALALIVEAAAKGRVQAMCSTVGDQAHHDLLIPWIVWRSGLEVLKPESSIVASLGPDAAATMTIWPKASGTIRCSDVRFHLPDLQSYLQDFSGEEVELDTLDSDMPTRNVSRWLLVNVIVAKLAAAGRLSPEQPAALRDHTDLIEAIRTHPLWKERRSVPFDIKTLRPFARGIIAEMFVTGTG